MLFFVLGCLIITEEDRQEREERFSAIDSAEETENQLPVVESISLSPETVYTNDTLVATAVISDPDAAQQEDLSARYDWYVNGGAAPVQSGTENTLSGEDFFNKGQQVSVVVTPSDGVAEGSPVSSSSVTIANSDPSGLQVSIESSDSFYNDSVLTCTASASDIDPEDTELSYSYLWSTEDTGPELILDGSLLPETEISCTATVSDGYGSGAEVSLAATETLVNRAPTIDSISLPQDVTAATSALFCDVLVSDADGETPTLSYSWTVDGASIAETTETLSGPFALGEEIVCTVEFTDAAGTGGVDSATTIVGNAPPVVDSVTLSPETVYTNDTITATVTLSDLDTVQVDAEALNATYDWSVDGSLVQSGPENTLSGVDYFQKGQEVSLSVTPNDGLVDGLPVIAEAVTIANSLPVLSTVTLTPEAPVVGQDDLLCAAEASDADGDSLSYTFEWSNTAGIQQSNLVQPNSGEAATDAFLRSGLTADTWTCTVNIDDGEASGQVVSEAKLVTSNCEEDEINDCNGNCAPSDWLADGDCDVNVFRYNDILIDLSCEALDFDSGDCADVDGDGVVSVQDCDDNDASDAAFANDCDRDGVLAENDCSDSNPSDVAFSGDCDQDGVLTGDDCDDNNAADAAFSGDCDQDGIASIEDCSDNDASDASFSGDCDQDGLAAADDCNDYDDTDTALADDCDQDGLAKAEDCDDDDDTDTALADDCDQDGIANTQDNCPKTANPDQADSNTDGVGDVCTDEEDLCDAANPSSTTIADDADCDGVLTADDCDDDDPSLLAIADDADCDGVLTEDDCDDGDSSNVNLSGDCDQDGILTGDDCDDEDPSLLAIAEDADCDGVLIADDCDDTEPSDASLSGDCDQDGVLTGDDCDDDDPSLLAIAEDADCDGVLIADDCDDSDPSDASLSGDCDEDGVAANDDCDDIDPVLGALVDDADCDGVLTADDCDDADPSDASFSGDCDQDGVAAIDDCDDTDAASTIVAEDADCDGVLTADDCDDDDPSLLAIADDADCDGVRDGCGLTDCDANLDLGGDQSIDLVLIPAGDDPLGRYTLTNDFYLMTTEVTQGMFAQLMGYDSHDGQSTTYGVGSDYPAYYVSWHMAADFANAATQHHNTVYGTNLEECYSCTDSGTMSVSCTELSSPYECSGYVLPTDAEWEYAARSGTEYDFWTPNGGGDCFSSGEDCSSNTTSGTETIQDGMDPEPLLRDYAWYGGNNGNAYGTSGSKEVGQKLPNGFGLYDMYGNLEEWTTDWSGCSFPSTSIDPYCSSIGSHRVRRGGSWGAGPVTAVRRFIGGGTPEDRYYQFGFRLRLHADSMDVDQDGVLAWQDCDDTDPSSTSISEDPNCDGVICGLTDCDANLDLGGDQSMDMVLIPAGDDPLGRYVLHGDFYLMTTEVTQGMFSQLMGYESYGGNITADANGSVGVGADYPAYHVSWDMAADFANKATQRHNLEQGTSLEECYSCTDSGTTSVSCTATISPYMCSGYVLPTEAEWEYAARSGSSEEFWTADGGGDSSSASGCTGEETIQDGSAAEPLLRDYAWYCGNNNTDYGIYGTKIVGGKLSNDFGLYDMHGNLSEWTADGDGCSFPESASAPYCTSTDSDRVRKGGYWVSDASLMRASYQSADEPTARYYYVGFRLGRHLDNVDLDQDGSTAWLDCDDGDPFVGDIADDADCDGVLTADDCDDADPSLLASADDADCDGICDAFMTSVVDDADCDGISDDCGLTDCDVNLDLGNGQSIDLVLIPAGDDPLGRYTISSDFYMMTTEVTQGMFAELMGYQSYDGKGTSDATGSYGIGSNYPAYNVSWHMAADFANTLTQWHNTVYGTSLQQCYSCTDTGTTSVSCTELGSPYECSGYVLPTEAEREYAARSGTTSDFWTPDGGGNYSANSCTGTETIQDGSSPEPLLREYAWYCGNRDNAYGDYGAKEVVQTLPNGFGLYDMYGNILEWSADWYGCTFPSTSIDPDPYCSSVASARVIRGGHWNEAPGYMRASHSNGATPTVRVGHIGFRLRLQAESIDADQDGVLAWEDCDDGDDAVGSSANDADCDGVETADDCDDGDPSLLEIANDADCDGAVTINDCDDDNDLLWSNTIDTDCDGFLDLQLLSSDSSFSCAINNREAIQCWGNNNWGQLSPPLGNFREVSASGNTGCALDINGDISCWGSTTFIPGAGTFIGISQGNGNFCAISSENTLQCGPSGYGGVAQPSGNHVQAATTGGHACAIDTSGTIQCWGDEDRLNSPVGSFSQISAAGYHACAIDTFGTIHCWGGEGTHVDFGQTNPPNGQFIKIASGPYNSCAIDSTHQVICWGKSTNGVNSPPSDSFVQISVGGDFACGITTEQAVLCWGTDTYGAATPPVVYLGIGL